MQCHVTALWLCLVCEASEYLALGPRCWLTYLFFIWIASPFLSLSLSLSCWLRMLIFLLVCLEFFLSDLNLWMSRPSVQSAIAMSSQCHASSSMCCARRLDDSFYFHFFLSSSYFFYTIFESFSSSFHLFLYFLLCYSGDVVLVAVGSGCGGCGPHVIDGIPQSDEVKKTEYGECCLTLH